MSSTVVFIRLLEVSLVFMLLLKDQCSNIDHYLFNSIFEFIL